MLPARARFVRAASAAPDEPGAYLLVVRLDAPLAVTVPGRAPVTLPPGRYVYAGSARGPGGLRARLAHHFRHDKAVHWHIDRLTLAGEVEGAWAVPGGQECALLEALGEQEAPLPGFGSSDCRRCTSHLRRWNGRWPAPTA